MLTNLFCKLGFTRDDAKWFWGKVLGAAAIIASGWFDVGAWAQSVGIPLGPIGVHIVQSAAVFVLWISGSNDKSSLPGDPAKKTDAGSVSAATLGRLGALVLAVVLTAGASATLPACALSNPPQTKVATVADVATKIQQSATVILHAARDANAIILPSTGRPLVSRQQLDDVAIAVNKVGHLGLVVKSALDDYNAVKTAGGDLTAQRAVVQKAIGDVSAAMTAVGKAIPNGTLQSVDEAVTTVLGLVAQVKAGVGL